MEQKFFFFDIDNTLAVWPEGKIPNSAQYCIDELQRRGHLVSIATGRIQDVYKRQLPFTFYGNIISEMNTTRSIVKVYC